MTTWWRAPFPVSYPVFWSRTIHLGASRRTCLHQLMESLPDRAILVVRKHPLESDSVCEESLSEYPASRCRVVGDDIDLYGLMNAASVWVVLVSTSASEAIMLNKPVVVIHNPVVHIMPFQKHGLTIVAHTAAELRSALERCIVGGPTPFRITGPSGSG